MRTTFISSAFAVLFSIFLLSSCSGFKQMEIDKRHYRNGFYLHTTDHRKMDQQADAVAAVNAIDNVSQLSGPEISPVENAAALPAVSQNAVTNSASALSSPETKKSCPMPAPSTQQHMIRNIVPVLPAHSSAAGYSGLMLVLMILLAIFFSPLAVIIHDQHTSTRFWVILICWLIAVGCILGGFPLAGLLGLIAAIWALLIIFDAA